MNIGHILFIPQIAKRVRFLSLTRYVNATYENFLGFEMPWTCYSLSFGHKNEIWKKTEERRKDRLVTLVHPIEATLKFSYSPYKMMSGE